MPRISREDYWKTMIRRIGVLLAVWFICGYVLSIFVAEPLNQISFGGIPLGFWMSQQGSIFVFISLIFLYAYFTEQLDKDAGAQESDDPPPVVH